MPCVHARTLREEASAVPEGEPRDVRSSTTFPPLPCWHGARAPTAGPALNTEATPQDWVVAEGYAMRSGAALAKSSLSQALYGPAGATFSNWTACRANCSRTPGCAAYKWLPATGACQHYLNEPNATNLLAPCNASTEAGCVFGYRLPGTCGRSASQGIRSVREDAPHIHHLVTTLRIHSFLSLSSERLINRVPTAPGLGWLTSRHKALGCSDPAFTARRSWVGKRFQGWLPVKNMSYAVGANVVFMMDSSDIPDAVQASALWWKRTALGQGTSPDAVQASGASARRYVAGTALSAVDTTRNALTRGQGATTAARVLCIMAIIGAAAEGRGNTCAHTARRVRRACRRRRPPSATAAARRSRRAWPTPGWETTRPAGCWTARFSGTSPRTTPTPTRWWGAS